MAYDEKLADRVRRMLSGKQEVAEKKMMGALTFMVRGNMCCGVTGTALMVRVGSAGYEIALAQPHVRPMEIGGRRPRAFICVEAQGCATDAALAEWVSRGVAFVSSLDRKDAADKKSGSFVTRR
ncbi:MAG: TfoX/Sxy family protein [Pseudomonadota bacterium]